MDAAAYLSRHGWRGEGHSLDPHGRGIKKRLLVSKRHGNIGIGKKKHDPAADQWWQGAFDGALKNLNVNSSGSVSPATSVAPKPVPVAPIVNRKWAGLYTSFVRGSTLDSTIDKTDALTQKPEPVLVDLPPEWSSDKRSHKRFDGDAKPESKPESSATSLERSMAVSLAPLKNDDCASKTPKDDSQDIKPRKTKKSKRKEEDIKTSKSKSKHKRKKLSAETP